MLENHGYKKRVLIGHFGQISYSRAVLVPADPESARILFALKGVRSIAPLDCFLLLNVIPFKMTCPFLCDVAKEAVRARSYGDAAIQIQEKHQVKVSTKQVERITNLVADVVFTEETRLAEEAKRAGDLDSSEHRMARNDRLYIEIDGAMVPTRAENGDVFWREDKLAMVFHSSEITISVRVDDEIERKIGSREYTGYIGSVDEFKYYLIALLLWFDIKNVSEIIVLSDGAKWIHNIVKELLPARTVHILDLYHAKQHAGEFANYVRRGEQKKIFADRLCQLLEDGKIGVLLNELEPYKNVKTPEGIPNMYYYVLNHYDMMHYDLYKLKGYIVGSGAIESGNRIVMQNRLKLPGMRWSEPNANRMLALKAKYESGLWGKVESIMQEYFMRKNTL